MWLNYNTGEAQSIWYLKLVLLEMQNVGIRSVYVDLVTNDSCGKTM